jgi:hypothetical protein
MSIFFKASTAFVVVAPVTGNLPPLSPHWRAADLHQARVKAAVFSLFRNEKG